MSLFLNLVFVHGGCFGGGNSAYDSELRKVLSEAGHSVTSVEFPTDSGPDAAINAIKAHAMKIPQSVLVGVSSGGALALAASSRNLPAVLICPSLKPHSRHTSLPETLQMLQLKFFHTMERMKEFEDRLANIYSSQTHSAVIHGFNDDRSPLPAGKWVATLGYPTGHNLCKTVPPMEVVIMAYRILDSEPMPVHEVSHDFRC